MTFLRVPRRVAVRLDFRRQRTWGRRHNSWPFAGKMKTKRAHQSTEKEIWSRQYQSFGAASEQKGLPSSNFGVSLNLCFKHCVKAVPTLDRGWVTSAVITKWSGQESGTRVLTLHDASPCLRNTRSVVIQAICYEAENFKYTSLELLNDPHVASSAISRRVRMIEHADEVAKDTEEVMLTALRAKARP